MKKLGTIVGSRLRWEGPYLFLGWKDAQSKRQAVIQDATGRKWFRVSFQLRNIILAWTLLAFIYRQSRKLMIACLLWQNFCNASANCLQTHPLYYSEDCREDCENEKNGGLPIAGKDSPFLLTSRAFFTNRWQD
jgi:hypothetical protein